MTHQKLAGLPAKELQQTSRTNVFALFYRCKSATPVMKPVPLSIVSVEAYQPKSQLLAYPATKACAEEAIASGIRVSTVVWGSLIPTTMPLEQVRKFRSKRLFKRPAQPVERSPVYVLLASPEAVL